MAAPPLLELNFATREELMEVTWVGDSRAQIILSMGPYATWEDVCRLPGIGKGIVSSLKERFSLSPMEAGALAAVRLAKAQAAIAQQQAQQRAQQAQINAMARQIDELEGQLAKLAVNQPDAEV
eukprot:NODE_2380_length_560_cov_256.819961_g1888_i0.p1 GENE.NODE_2380_length_560_cov_256.819961_g1888_i0~~NODE_2380_length_560_cov_256.819961_g1888_i0.p1  ORF type:complete len:142 (-),score=48.74 NODE_2380_length_560_cov_256.819961_g1888_i0:134-505(-)